QRQYCPRGGTAGRQSAHALRLDASPRAQVSRSKNIVGKSTMPLKKLPFAATAAAIATALLLVACGGDKPEALLASAKEYIAKNDYKAAVIQVKNVLQKQPDLPEARFLLGSSLLASGDVAAAEIELYKARA